MRARKSDNDNKGAFYFDFADTQMRTATAVIASFNKQKKKEASGGKYAKCFWEAKLIKYLLNS